MGVGEGGSRRYFIMVTLYRLNVHSRWVIRYEDFFYDYTSIPTLYKSIVRKRMAEITYTVGVGRHSDAEIDEMMKHDLMMLSEILGK